MLQALLLTPAMINHDLLKKVNRLHAQLSGGEPYALGDLKAVVAQGFCHYVVVTLAEEGEPPRIIGKGSLYVLRKDGGFIGQIEDVVIDEGSRSKGVGRFLAMRLEEIGRGCGVLYIDLTSSDRHAPGFWSKMGYQERKTHMFRKRL